MYLPLISEAINAVSGYMQRKQEQKAIKIKGQVERLAKSEDAVAEWERIQAENARYSWKDEWFTILLSIPLILAFFPGAVEYTKAGFAALEEMPDYYQYWVGLAICTSFGVRVAKK